ncbi:MAG: phytanoyl-CoA dioxygenase family protein [Anaerolineaceae bacterium]|nr:phytanoyl-CoA dioxygenase family protein [Anaerolineaceae bacterium]
MIVTEAQREQYRREGYFILESVIPEVVLEGLREECGRLVAGKDARMEAKGITTDGISHYHQRYFISNEWRTSAAISDFLFGDLMAEVGRATLGENVYLFHEQYVVKAAERGMKFAWHQDSGYIGHYHRPYLSCWCSLDDMTIENGTVYVLPYARAGMQPDDLFDHRVEDSSNDKVGYHGDDPGVAALVPAGSVVAFSSRTFHRSGPNTTDRMRRVYLAQYSAEPIMNKAGDATWNQAIPLLLNGERQPAPQPVAAAN